MSKMRYGQEATAGAEPPQAPFVPRPGMRVVRKSQVGQKYQRGGMVQYVVKGGKYMNVEFLGCVRYHLPVSEFVPCDWETTK